MAHLPAGLDPSEREHGLLGVVGPQAEVDEQAAARMGDDTVAAWSALVDSVAEADLSAAPRGSSARGVDLVLGLGAWPEQRRAVDIAADARAGRVGTEDRDAITARILAAHPDADADAAREALARARDEMRAWWASDDATELAARPVRSVLGTLPVATLMHASAYQAALTVLDLRPCGARVEPALMAAGLRALVDVTGALSAREGVTATITARTPGLMIGFGSRDGAWRTRDVDATGPLGPGVEATAEVILDITSGRADVAGLWRRGDLTVHDLSALLAVVPVVTGVPGIPGAAALRGAVSVMSGVGALLSRLPFGRRP